MAAARTSTNYAISCRHRLRGTADDGMASGWRAGERLGSACGIISAYRV